MCSKCGQPVGSIRNGSDGVFIFRKRGDSEGSMHLKRLEPPKAGRYSGTTEFWCPGCKRLGETDTDKLVKATAGRPSAPIRLRWTLVEPPQGWAYVWDDSAADSRSDSEPDPPR